MRSCGARACGLALTNPQPSDAELGEMAYGPRTTCSSENDPAGEALGAPLQTRDGRSLPRLARAGAGVAARGRPCSKSAAAPGIASSCGPPTRGFEVTGARVFALRCAERAPEKPRRPEASVLVGRNHRARRSNPDAYDDVRVALRRDRARAASGRVRARDPAVAAARRSVLLVVTPSLDSWSARVLGSRWMEYKAEHLYYFTRATITRQLQDAGYADVPLRAGVKEARPPRLRRRAFRQISRRRHHAGAAAAAPRSAPRGLREHLFSIVASGGLVALARKPKAPPNERATRRLIPLERRVLSVVVPVFNERATAKESLDAIVAKNQFPAGNSRSSSSRAIPPTARATSCKATRTTRALKLVFEDTTARQGPRGARGLQARDRRG